MRGFHFQAQKNLGRLDVGSLLAFRALRDFELNFLTFFESLEAVHVDRGEMCKQIFAAIIRSDEAEAFGVIEPLNCTCCHKKNFQIKTNHTSHKSKKLLAPSSTSHSQPAHCCTSRYRIVGGIIIEVKRFSIAHVILSGSCAKATLDFTDWAAICAQYGKRVRLGIIGVALIFAHCINHESIRISVWRPSMTQTLCSSGRR